MDKESNTGMSNANRLPWPQDTLGITHRLRREGCRAIGRMDGKSERLDLIMATLRVLAKHSAAKLDQQLASKAKIAALQLQRSEEAARQNAAQLRRQADALRKQIGGLEGRLDRVVDAGKETPNEVS